MYQQKLSRRDLLKVLAAAAGTAALSSVPNKWKTPVVEVGMLPAHAQGLSGLGAIEVTVHSNVGAPVKQSKLPNPLTCAFATVSVTIVPAVSPQCCDENGTVTFTNIPTGDYTVHCYVEICGSLPDQVAHVVAPGTVSLTFNAPACG